MICKDVIITTYTNLHIGIWSWDYSDCLRGFYLSPTNNYNIATVVLF